MRQISTEELIAKGVTRYSLIIGISKRAREIAEYNDSMAIQPEHKPILQAAESTWRAFTTFGRSTTRTRRTTSSATAAFAAVFTLMRGKKRPQRYGII